MAGMFYSLQEAAEKLNKTEDELKKLVKEGKLREFRDGANLLFKVDEVENLVAEEADIIGLTEDAESETSEHEFPDLEIEAPETSEPELVEEDLSTADMAESFDSTQDAEPAEPSEAAADTDEILLAPETGAAAVPSDLTDADTALTGMGTSVLGETDQDYEVTDDTMAETAIPTGTAGTTPEVPLEEIEEDVNLDTFGSGSGLLDLSLQADDTSLGGILDEIYTAEGEGQEPAEAAEADGPAAVAPGAAEPEQMISEEELAIPQPAAEAGVLAAPLIEVAPDAQSNILGMLLFLPLVVVIYTTVVVAAGVKGVIPSILGSIQSFIWYIMGGAAVLALLITGAAFLLTGERGAAVKAEKKPKEPKKAKEPKLKKAKKGKEA